MNFNIMKTFNILECMRIFPAKHFLFASTSSIYGLDTKAPYKENYKTDYPISLYALTKVYKIMIHSFSIKYHQPALGFLLFMIYAGRPDMAYFKFTKNILEERKLKFTIKENDERLYVY